VTQPVDTSILHEIVRIIESRRRVPEKVIVKSKEYLLTYLEDHQRRLEEALQRYDADRLNMLYGQLASKIKYQLMRRVPGRLSGDSGRAPKKTMAKAPVAKVKKKAGKSRPASAARKPAGKRRAVAKSGPRKKQHK